MKNVRRIIVVVATLVFAMFRVLVVPVQAITDDPQPCDPAAQAVTVRTTAAAIHAAAQLSSLTTTTVSFGEVLVVSAQQADEDVGCWYQVQTLTNSLPAPAWIAGSTIAVSVRAHASASASPSASPHPTVSAAPTPATAPAYAPPAYGPTAPYAPPAYAPPAYTYNPNNPYGVPLAPTLSPTPSTANSVDEDQLLVPRTVRSQVCLDANANTYCDVNEGVAGVPIYIVGAGGQVFAQTRTDGDGIISVVIRAPQRAQLTINVPYLSAYERVSNTGESAPILVPIGAAIPGLLP
jgi:hypothetical protein